MFKLWSCSNCKDHYSFIYKWSLYNRESGNVIRGIRYLNTSLAAYGALAHCLQPCPRPIHDHAKSEWPRNPLLPGNKKNWPTPGGQGARRKWIHRFWVAPSHLCYRHFYLGTLNALTWGVVRSKSKTEIGNDVFGHSEILSLKYS